MSNLTPRNKDLLKILISEDDYRSMNHYSKVLNISTRTLYSDINAINCSINKYHVRIDRKTGQGIKLLGKLSDKMQLLYCINYEDEKEKKYSTKERQLEIARLLLIEEETVSYQKLSEYFFVSKTSISKDIDVISSFLSEKTISIQSDKKGTRIVGTESGLQYSLNIYTKLLLEESCCSGEESFFITGVKILKKIYPEKVVEMAFKIASDIDHSLNIGLSDYYIKSLVITLLVFIYRLSKDKHIHYERQFVFEEVNTLQTYLISKNILETISRGLNISFYENDIDYLNRQLIAHGLEPKIKNEAETDMYRVLVADIIKEMSDVMHVDLTKDEKLFNGIIYHIIPMEYRLRMGLKIENPLLNEIKTQYSVTFSATWYVMSKVENVLGITLTEDEVAFIMVHFQAAIDRNIAIKKILIVCPTGIGTSELIANKIKRFLPSQDVVEVVPIRKVYENDIDNVDLIISSVQLTIKDKPVIYISPLVNNSDLKNISNFYGELFYNEAFPENKAKNYSFKYLSETLDKDYIFTNRNYTSKEECLIEIIKAMEEKQDAAEGFKESILEREKLGTTSLESGAAIPHAAPETVINSRIAIMTLKNFIRWDNKMVNAIILICIAKKDMLKIKNILSEIYQIVENKDSINHLLVGKSKKEILESLGGI